MGTANRILAIEPDNQNALDQLATAYRLLNRELLGQGPRQNVPPAVSFVDSRQELEDAIEEGQIVLRYQPKVERGSSSERLTMTRCGGSPWRLPTTSTPRWRNRVTTQRSKRSVR